MSGSFAFVDLDHYCFAPVVRDGGCEKGLVEDPEERCLVVFRQATARLPLEGCPVLELCCVLAPSAPP